MGEPPYTIKIREGTSYLSPKKITTGKRTYAQLFTLLMNPDYQCTSWEHDK
jgi:hypothetical protein